ncbi:MAG: metal/formaldehyde-sensitive transcriptional repressor [Planctomycetes bacterium]|nr:metal/formaldehyde-sensitive transcriptional repressor [Planctomycetota bacterium]
MAHTTASKKKLLNRVRRIQGQIRAVERAIEEEHDCSSVLQLVAACRGATNGLMAELLEGHIRTHVIDPGGDPASKQAAEQVIDIVRAYLK